MTKRSWRLLAGAAVVLAGTLPVWGADISSAIENNTSRWGSDYKRFTIGSAEACAVACNADEACRAWSFIKPTDNSPSAMCRLKSAAPQAKADPCCISGLGQVAIAGAPEAHRQIAESKPQPSGVTGAIRKKDKKTKPVGAPEGSSASTVLQMPIEAETPEALTAISAPLDMPDPTR